MEINIWTVIGGCADEVLAVSAGNGDDSDLSTGVQIRLSNGKTITLEKYEECLPYLAFGLPYS